MIKKVISCFILASVVMVSFSTPANASVVRGKKYYIKYLKDACGFKGDVMGKHHTKKEWRDIVMNTHSANIEDDEYLYDAAWEFYSEKYSD